MTTHLAVPTLHGGGDFDEETNPVGFAENNHTATKIQLIRTVAKTEILPVLPSDSLYSFTYGHWLSSGDCFNIWHKILQP